MKIAVIGGIWTLARNYSREVEKQGHECVHFNGYSRQLDSGLRHADAIIIFTSTVSHQAADMARSRAREQQIPLICATGSGISALRRCLSEIPSGPKLLAA